MSIGNEEDAFPMYGISTNEQIDYDDQCIAKMMGRNKPASRQISASRLQPLPLKEIVEELTYSVPLEEPVSPAYLCA